MLVFAETYDPLWGASVYRDEENIQRARTIPVYGILNGFWIEETGNLIVEIRYVPHE